MNHSSAISSPYVQFVLFFPHQKCSLSTQMLISQKRDLCHWINLHEHTSLVLCCLLLDIDWLQERILFAKNVQRLTTERKIHVCISLHGAASFTGACFFFVFLQWALLAGLWPPVPSFPWSTKTLESQRQIWALTQYDRWRKAVCHLFMSSSIILKPGTFCTNKSLVTTAVLPMMTDFPEPTLPLGQVRPPPPWWKVIFKIFFLK